MVGPAGAGASGTVVGGSVCSSLSECSTLEKLLQLLGSVSGPEVSYFSPGCSRRWFQRECPGECDATQLWFVLDPVPAALQ